MHETQNGINARAWMHGSECQFSIKFKKIDFDWNCFVHKSNQNQLPDHGSRIHFLCNHVRRVCGLRGCNACHQTKWNKHPQLSSLVLIRGNDGGPHHDLPVSAGSGQHGSAAGLEPAVQRAFFSWSRATARPAPLQSRVANGVIVASKRQRNTSGVDGGLTDCIISFSLNVEFGVMVLAGPFFGPALAIRAVCRAGIICAA